MTNNLLPANPTKRRRAVWCGCPFPQASRNDDLMLGIDMFPICQSVVNPYTHRLVPV